MKLSERLASGYDIGSNNPAGRDGELRDSTLLFFLVELWAKLLFVSFLSSVTAVIQFEDHVDRGGYGVYFKAQKLWMFSTTTPITVTPDTDIRIYLAVIIILLAGFVIFYAGIEGYKARTSKNCESLTLRFENPNTHITIPWTTLLYPLHESHLQALSTLRRVRVDRQGWKLFLNFNWDFEICHVASGLKQRPQSKIQLSIREYFKLSNILNGFQRYHTTLWVTKAGSQQEILIEPASTLGREQTDNNSNSDANV